MSIFVLYFITNKNILLKMKDSLNALLREYPQDKVNVYIDYVNELKADSKSKNWANSKSVDYYSSKFQKVASLGLFIDGDTVTLTALGVSYDYNAYKNMLLLKYPETIIDAQLVYKGDDFTFKKENGQIYYKHSFANPFITNKKIIGAYAVVKNSRGNFIEFINDDDIKKFKNSSKMSFIWKNWEDRMVLKSVIKRICKKAFYDIVSSMESEDNLHSDPSKAAIPSTIQDQVRACKSVHELAKLFKPEWKKDREIVLLFSERRAEIENDPNTKFEIDNKKLDEAIGNIITGTLQKEDFLDRYYLSKEQKVYFEKSLKGE